MPANLTPAYVKAERAYREAEGHDEKLAALEEMLRAVPKHKGTEKIQADLKRKIAQMRREAPKKAGGHRDIFHVPKQGGGQVVLVGTPNTGKSALVAALTNAPVKVETYPFSTQAPVPGMAHHEDVPIQLVDMPPITAEHVPPGMVGRLRQADVLAIVVDLASPSALEDLEPCRALLVDRGLLPEEQSGDTTGATPVLVIGTRQDLPEAAENLAVLEELYGSRIEIQPVSATTSENLDALMHRLFELLRIMRVYSKPPGKPADRTAPFVLPVGSNVLDMARTVHRDLPDRLRSARVWGQAVHDGQQVHLDHVLYDKDIVELHEVGTAKPA